MAESVQEKDLEKLVRAYVEGVGAFFDLLDHFKPWLTETARHRIDAKLRQRFSGQDVVADLFADLVRRVPRFQWQTLEEYKSWLHGKMRDKYLDMWDKETRSPRDPTREVVISPANDGPADVAIAARGPTPSGETRTRIALEAWEEGIRKLPEADQILIRLSFEEQWSDARISRLLNGTNDDSARRALARRLAKLLSSLIDLSGDDLREGEP